MVQIGEDAPTTRTSSSSSSGAAPTSSSGSHDVVTRTNNSGEESETSKMESKRKAERECEEDPELEDGKWMRMEGKTWSTIEEEEERLLKSTVKYLKMLERPEAKQASA